MENEPVSTAQQVHPWFKFYDPHVPHSLTYPRIPIHALLQGAAEKYPERPCARFFGKQFSFRSLNQLSDRLAAALRQGGLQPGERVVLLLPNCPQFIVAYYGILKAGGVVVPVNPLSADRELAFFIGNSGAQTVITIPLFAGRVAGLALEAPLKHLIVARLADFLPFPASLVQGIKEARQMRGAAHPGLQDFRRLLDGAATAGFQAHAPDPDELAVLIYSGGTTGVAKGIMLSHFNCVANAHQLMTWGDLNYEQRLLAVLPLFHGFGMSVTMNCAILAGGEVVLMPRFKARDALAAIQKTRPTFFVGVPTMFVAFNNLPGAEKYDLTSLQAIFVGAAPLTKAIKDTFESKIGGTMIEGYGLTEAVTAIMANPRFGLQKVGSIGLPFPDVEMKIIDLQDGHDLPPGQTGEIILRSPTVMLGYYQDLEQTRQALVDGWLYTGDIGHMDEDGYFYITDRKKELIITGGFNVFPREILEVLYQHPKVKEGAVIGLPDAYLGERIKAFVVLKDGESATPEEVIAFCKEHLTRYKVPAEVAFRAELPKSMIGKILPRLLKEEEAKKGQASQKQTQMDTDAPDGHR